MDCENLLKELGDPAGEWFLVLIRAINKVSGVSTKLIRMVNSFEHHTTTCNTYNDEDGQYCLNITVLFYYVRPAADLTAYIVSAAFCDVLATQ